MICVFLHRFQLTFPDCYAISYSFYTVVPRTCTHMPQGINCHFEGNNWEGKRTENALIKCK